MFEAFIEIIKEYLNAELVIGALVTAFLAQGLISFVTDKMKRENLKKWEKIGCAFVSAFFASMALNPLFHGEIMWGMIPGNTFLIGFTSDFFYENIIKRWQERNSD